MSKEPKNFLQYQTFFARWGAGLCILMIPALLIANALALIMLFCAMSFLALGSYASWKFGQVEEQNLIVPLNICPQVFLAGIMLSLVALVAWIT